MEFVSIPTIVIICYIAGEMFKLLFSKRRGLFKFIPLLLPLLGG
jgi:hypothetical protein